MPQVSATSRSPLLRSDTSAGGWQPEQVGLPRAFALAGSIVGLLMVALVLLAGRVVPPPPVTVRLMDAASEIAVAAAAAAPPTPAAVAPSPAALMPPPLAPAAASVPLAEAALLPELVPPVAMPSPIAVPELAAPPVAPLPVPTIPTPQRPRVLRHVTPSQSVRSEMSADAPTASERIAPGPVLAALRPEAAPTAPADVVSGLGPYRAGLHRQIERNMLSDRATARLGVSGTAVIEATIVPDGRVASARLARTSGVRAIDDAALGAVQRGGFPAFGPHMPPGPITVSVPIAVEAD